MASLIRRLLRGNRSISTIDDYIAALNEFYFQGNAYAVGMGSQTTTYGRQPMETAGNTLEGYGRAAYASDGVVFAVMAVRMAVFSAIRFQFQQLNQGRPGDLFSTPALQPLESPEGVGASGTTQDLLIRMIQDVDLQGNAYLVRDLDQLVRLRPDWVQCILEARFLGGGHCGWRKIGYAYWEGGVGASDPAVFAADEVAHFAPTPDPLATYRGMSWLTPVLREIANDKAMTSHQSKFFEHAAVPNMIIKLGAGIGAPVFEEFRKNMELAVSGSENAYKNLYLGAGSDVQVVGQNFRQMDFKQVRAGGETRIAAAGGVPPILVGLTEGLASATYSNYVTARRRFADGTMHPLWQNVAGSCTPIVDLPARGVRLWYDARDVAFLREDKKDGAEIQGRQADTIRTLIEAGYEPESVQAAVLSEDWKMLVHTGMTSVQLQKPGAKDAEGDGEDVNSPEPPDGPNGED